MAILRVNANRMELNRLKVKLSTASNGHKLLKDKRDSLMKQFISLVRENEKLRKSVEGQLVDALEEFMLASSKVNPKMIEQAVSSSKSKLRINIDTKNLMGVRVPMMKYERLSMKEDDKVDNIHPYGFVQTSVELDKSIEGVNEVFERMIELAEIEKTTQLLADEIEKTRRRVNALEHRTIPDYKDTIEYIRMKLDENERATVVRLMKVKDMGENKGKEKS